MSLFNALGKLLRPDGSVAAELICPRCDQVLGPSHDDKDCASKGMSRRFFFGLMGATSAALAMRLEGIPLPTAHHMVVAHAGDYIRVKPAGDGVFAVAWERPKSDHGVRRINEGGAIILASTIEKFMGDEADRIYVDTNIPEMRITGVFDEHTHKPLEFRVVRASEVQAYRQAEEKRRREAEIQRHRQTIASREMHCCPRGLECFFRVPVDGDYVRQQSGWTFLDNFHPALGGDPRVCYRPVKGFELVYNHQYDSYQVQKLIPAHLRRLLQKYPKHPTVSRAALGNPLAKALRELPA